MNTARHDPVEPRFAPEAGLVIRAHNALLDEETARGGSHRYVRQRWEEGFAAVRVALTALREIYPAERDAMDQSTRSGISMALFRVESAYEHLDDVGRSILGEVMHGVLNGRVTSHEALDDLGVPR